MSEMYVDEEIINFLFEQLKISLKEKIKEESFNYKYKLSIVRLKRF